MPLSGSVIVEPNDAVVTWLLTNSIPDAFPTQMDAKEVGDSRWSTYFPGGTNPAGVAIDTAGANFVHAFFWADALSGQNQPPYDIDVAFFARQTETGGAAAMVPVLVCRVTWSAASTLLESTIWPISTQGTPVSGPYYLCSAINFAEPSAGAVLAQNNLDATVLQRGGLGALLQIPAKGFNNIGVRVRKKYGTTSGQPYRVWITCKLR